MSKKTSKKHKKFFKRVMIIVKKPGVLITLVTVLPLMIGLIYSIPTKQFVKVSSGDLLSYYGVVFGIISSWMLYTHEEKKKDSIRKSNLMPTFDVKVNKDDNNYFNIKLINYSKGLLSSLFLYDEFVSETVKESMEFTAIYNETTQVREDEKDLYHIYESGIIDEDGYPKYIQFICSDVDSNAWVCNFEKHSRQGEIKYISSYFYTV